MSAYKVRLDNNRGYLLIEPVTDLVHNAETAYTTRHKADAEVRRSITERIQNAVLSRNRGLKESDETFKAAKATHEYRQKACHDHYALTVKTWRQKLADLGPIPKPIRKR